MNSNKVEFVFYKDYILHKPTGTRFPTIRVLGAISKESAGSVMIGFADPFGTQRKIEISWNDFLSWPNFEKTLGKYGYLFGDTKLGQALHRELIRKPNPRRIILLPAMGWWPYRYVPPDQIIERSAKLAYFFRGTDGSLRSECRGDLKTWSEQVASPSANSPPVMVVILSGLGAILLPAATDVPSFCISYPCDEASDREVLRRVGASVSGLPKNLPLRGSPQWTAEVAAGHRHALLCVDIPDLITPKEINSFFKPLLSARGAPKSRPANGCVPVDDLRLLVLATGTRNHVNHVPRSIYVPSIVDPEMRMYDSLGNGWTPDAANRVLLKAVRRNHGVAAVAFRRRIEKSPAATWSSVQRLTREFIGELNPATEEEWRRARAIALLWAAGRLGIEWRILPWTVERLRSVLRQLYVAACESLPDPKSVNEEVLAELRQHLREAKKLPIERRGNRVSYTAQQVQDADIFLEDNYMLVPPSFLLRKFSRYEIQYAINHLKETSYLETDPRRSHTNTIQRRISFYKVRRPDFYKIPVSFTGEVSSTNVPSENGGGVEESLAVVEPQDTLLARINAEFNQSGSTFGDSAGEPDKTDQS
jgi:hypothetical protein